jgi:hypothetical protein
MKNRIISIFYNEKGVVEKFGRHVVFRNTCFGGRDAAPAGTAGFDRGRAVAYCLLRVARLLHFSPIIKG